MRLSQAFAVRDQINKQELYRRFGNDEQTMSKIRLAFSDGQKRWEDELKALFGEPEVQRLKEALPRELKL